MNKHSVLLYIGGFLFVFPIIIFGFSILSMVLQSLGSVILIYVDIKKNRGSRFKMVIQIIVIVFLLSLSGLLNILETLPPRERSNLVEKIFPSNWVSWKTIDRAKDDGFTFDVPSTWSDIIPISLPYPISALLSLSLNSPQSKITSGLVYELFVPSFSKPLVRDYPYPLIFTYVYLGEKNLVNYFNDQGLDLKKDNCQLKTISNQESYLCEFDSNKPDILIINMPNGKAVLAIDPVKIPLTRKIIESIKVID